MERICDDVAFLNDGEIILQGSIEDVKSIRKGSSMEIDFYREEDAVFVAKKYADSSLVNHTRLLFLQKTEKDMMEMMAFLSQNHISIRRMEMLEPTLEELFVEVTSV